MTRDNAPISNLLNNNMYFLSNLFDYSEFCMMTHHYFGFKIIYRCFRIQWWHFHIHSRSKSEFFDCVKFGCHFSRFFRKSKNFVLIPPKNTKNLKNLSDDVQFLFQISKEQVFWPWLESLKKISTWELL